MDWLEIQSDDNQDIHHEFIGNLIMRDGFKVRYAQVELYTDELGKILRIHLRLKDTTSALSTIIHMPTVRSLP